MIISIRKEEEIERLIDRTGWALRINPWVTVMTAANYIKGGWLIIAVSEKDRVIFTDSCLPEDLFEHLDCVHLENLPLTI